MELKNDVYEVCNIRLTKRLADFLYKKGVLKAFVDNTINYNSPVPIPNIVENEVDLIVDAFAWRDSPEGIEFWNKIHKHWLCYLQWRN